MLRGRVGIRIPQGQLSKTFFSVFLSLVFSIFFVTKMYRSFSGSTVEGGIWNYIQLLFLALGFVLFLSQVNKCLKNILIVALLLFSVLAMINSMLFLAFDRNSLFNFLMIVYPAAVLIVVAADADRKEIDKDIILDAVFYIIAAMYIFNMLRAKSYSTQTGAVADVYYILGLLPIVLVHNKKKRLMPFIACGLAVLLSGKRAGILIFGAALITFYSFQAWEGRNFKNSVKSFLSIIIILSLFVGGLYIVGKTYNGIIILKLKRMWYENDTAGRSERWSQMLLEIKNSGFLDFFIGHGDGAVSKTFGGNAHNDFLEILYNYGFMPFTCYIGFYIFCFREFVGMVHLRYKYTGQFLMSLIYSLVLAMVSFYAITPTYITSGMICIGYMYSDFQKSKRSKRTRT